MEKVKWIKKMATNVELIDKQHKTFLELCDNLDQSVNSSKSKNEVLTDIKFLEDYSKVHFSTEKKLMEEKKYPEIAGHIKLHTYFLDEIKIIREKAAAGLNGVEFASEIKEKVTDWFVIHIEKTDKKLGKYINSLYK
jgi:hemerythrin